MTLRRGLWAAASLGATSVALAAGWYAAQSPSQSARATAVGPALVAAPAAADAPVARGTAARASLAAASPADPDPRPSGAEPPAAPHLSPEHRAEIQAVHQLLVQGPTLAACREAEPRLLALARGLATTSAGWDWTLARARDCLRAPHEFRRRNGLLAGLRESFPDDPRVLALAGLERYDAGALDEAVDLLEQAEDAGTFEAWEAYADAQLSRAFEMRAQGDPRWQDALLRAEVAAMRALELAGDDVKPFALHTYARTQLELGRAVEAVQWADQAIAALRAGGSRYQALMAAELYVFSGQIYYRAGQRETGLAYMDQGIGMAGPPEQQADLRRIRDQFLSRHGA